MFSPGGSVLPFWHFSGIRRINRIYKASRTHVVMTIKLNFKQEGNLKVVTYRITRSLFGYILSFILFLIVEFVVYGSLSTYPLFNGIPLYFHLILLAIVIFSYIPYKITLTYDPGTKELDAITRGSFLYHKRKATYADFEKFERSPEWARSLFAENSFFTSPVTSRRIMPEQVEQIAKYFGLKPIWIIYSLGQDPAFGIPLKNEFL